MKFKIGKSMIGFGVNDISDEDLKELKDLKKFFKDLEVSFKDLEENLEEDLGDLKDAEEDLKDLENFFKDLEVNFKDFKEDSDDLKDSNEDLEDFEEELQKVIIMASSRGIGCRVAEKVGGRIVKNKAKIKVAPKGIIIVCPPENDKRIPWEKIVNAEKRTDESLKINLVSDNEGVESPIIYLTNSYSLALLVKIINDSAKGELEDI